MSEHLPGNLCERLRELREARHLDQYEIADVIHVSRSTYSRIENGTAALNCDALIELAKFYDVPSDYILGIMDSDDKTYYELKELGISVDAAKNLYSGKVDPRVINELLVNEKFISAVSMMSIYFSGVMSEATRVNNNVKDFTYSLLGELVRSGDLPADKEMAELRDGIRLSKEPATQYEIDRIRNAVIAAIKEIREKIDGEAVDIRKERDILDKQIADKVKLEVKKVDWGRKLLEKQRQKKIVEAIKMGMSLDPNMTPEMIEEYTPAIEQIIMTYAKYGK
ncbi:MAG: helix-turn-helix transcriptional regulator [Lachnospiraceae bacterium]|nr:helix-turn-helix transcriptional regulator [Lachnospiraceae bacterium]